MKPSYLIAAAALLLVALLLTYGLTERPATQERERSGEAVSERTVGGLDTTDPELPPKASPPGKAGRDPVSKPDPGAVRQAERRVRDLEATLVLARQRLEEAEQGLAASEAEVEDLEQMIADIKARGEDPADYGDLAMERFQPAFFRFQDAQAAYDNAERLRMEAESALAEAQAELARRRSASAEVR